MRRVQLSAHAHIELSPNGGAWLIEQPRTVNNVPHVGGQLYLTAAEWRRLLDQAPHFAVLAERFQ